MGAAGDMQALGDGEDDVEYHGPVSSLSSHCV